MYDKALLSMPPRNLTAAAELQQSPPDTARHRRLSIVVGDLIFPSLKVGRNQHTENAKYLNCLRLDESWEIMGA